MVATTRVVFLEHPPPSPLHRPAAFRRCTTSSGVRHEPLLASSAACARWRSEQAGDWAAIGLILGSSVGRAAGCWLPAGREFGPARGRSGPHSFGAERVAFDGGDGGDDWPYVVANDLAPAALPEQSGRRFPQRSTPTFRTRQHRFRLEAEVLLAPGHLPPRGREDEPHRDDERQAFTSRATAQPETLAVDELHTRPRKRGSRRADAESGRGRRCVRAERAAASPALARSHADPGRRLRRASRGARANGEHLDHDAPSRRLVARLVDDPHAPAADGPNQFVVQQQAWGRRASIEEEGGRGQAAEVRL